LSREDIGMTEASALNIIYTETLKILAVSGNNIAHPLASHFPISLNFVMLLFLRRMVNFLGYETKISAFTFF